MKKIIAGALGECVHVAGISNFLRIAEEAGWQTLFLGPAVPIDEIIKVANQEQAEIVGVSYRLTPETGENLLAEFAEQADELRQKGVRFLFGGTPEVAKRADSLGFFEKVFSGEESDSDVLAYLKNVITNEKPDEVFPSSFCDRAKWKAPFPLIRHHFGLPTIKDTQDGIKRIALARVLDVISLGLDQDAQENFFHPERQKISRKGAGGVPVRSADEFVSLFENSRTGNFPLLRSYSGTDDFIAMAEMLTETIQNTWCAIPLFWFNKMDGRGPWNLEDSIRQHQNVMKWYGERNIPVELNEPHHWGMRDAPDVIFVVAGYLSAYNAKYFGVKDYIAQFMFNSPPGHNDAMDLAKMQAILEIIQPLESESFKIWKQTRTGLLSYPTHLVKARAHLASSIYLQMALKPDIVHVVGHTEAFHAATADDVIEACQMAQRVIETCIKGMPDYGNDAVIKKRVKFLVSQARILLNSISQLGDQMGENDSLSNPVVLAKAVLVGLLDAPQLMNNAFARGLIKTRVINGACEVVNESGNYIDEEERIGKLILE